MKRTKALKDREAVWGKVLKKAVAKLHGIAQRKKKDPKNLKVISDAVNACVEKMASSKEQEWVREFLTNLILNDTIPLELLKLIPTRAAEVGRTRFDQIYEIAMLAAFPGYSPKVVEELTYEQDPDIKVWKVILPAEYKINHVMIRARSFQEAFALGCDYACRANLRVNHKIPKDLTIRVSRVSNDTMLKTIKQREWARKSKRRVFKHDAWSHEGDALKDKRTGVRIFGLGNVNTSLIRYIDMRDLDTLRFQDVTTTSSVENESIRKPLDYEKIQKEAEDKEREKFLKKNKRDN